ncbi:MAG: hypothetical protein FWG02_07135 [Holophagaceae bacterium]|nr:hypothetical protein [Holophagaceae bacterium]
MSKLLKLASIPILLVFLAINIHSLYKSAIGVVLQFKIYLWFVVGFALYCIVRRFIKKNLDFLETFTHELIHTVIGLLFFHQIDKFNATSRNGEVIYHGGKRAGNIFILLAPYCLPIYPIIFLLFRFAIAPEYIWLINIVTGITTAFHAFAFKRDIHFRQPDIQNAGVLFSLIFIWTFLSFFTSIILWSVQSGLGGAFVHWWKNSVSLVKMVY